MTHSKKLNRVTVKIASFLCWCLLFIGGISLFSSCKDETKKEGVTTSDNPGKPEPAVVAAEARFHHLRIDSGTLVRTFFLSPPPPPPPPERFKKLLLSFTVKDYSDFPDSLTLWVQPAKNSDDLYNESGFPAVLAEVKDTVTVLISKDVLFNSLELSFDKLRKVVGRDGQALRYKEVIFIPFAKDSCGKKYLSYRVRTWPPIGGGSAPEEELNPCPPQKPNAN